MDKPGKIIQILPDNDEFYIECEFDVADDDSVIWINDNGDYSHPQSIPVYVADIPKLIEALQSVTKAAGEGVS